MLNIEKAKGSIVRLIIDILRAMGIIFLISPFFVYWFINGDSVRYQWIISGPYPFSSFGSGPFQLLLYISIIVVALILILCSVVISKINSKHN